MYRYVLAITGLCVSHLFAGAQAGHAQCSAGTGITFQQLYYQGESFFVDVNQSPTWNSSYIGVKITNATGSLLDDVVVRVTMPGGQVLRLDPNDTGIATVENLGAGSSENIYFYAEASGVTGDVTATQSYTVEAYDGPIAQPGTSSCGTATFSYINGSADGFQAIEDAIEANANKVASLSLFPDPVSSPGSYIVGGTFQLKVFGFFGTVGTSGAIVYTPAVLESWPAHVFELRDVTIALSNANFSNVGQCPLSEASYTALGNGGILYIPINNATDAAALNSRCYHVSYTFRIKQSQGTPTSISPRSYIASGTQAKVSNPSTATIPTIPGPTNTLVFDKESTSPASTDDMAVIDFMPGEASRTVTYRLTLSNTSPGTAVTVSDVIDDLPTTPTVTAYVDGTGTPNGGTITFTGSRLKFIGPFSVPAQGTLVFTYDVAVPNFYTDGNSGTWTNRAAVRVSGTEVGVDTLEMLGGGNLPVELTSIEARADGRAVLLRWTTASETNNAGFDVEHHAFASTDQRTGTEPSFRRIGFVEGHGTTVEPRSYQFRTEDLPPGRQRFRLRQIDYDGSYEYSPEVEAYVDLSASYIVEPAYPNPFNPRTQVHFAVQVAQRVEVSLYNALGQRVRALYTGEAAPGVLHVVEIDGSGLPSGLYLVRLEGERFTKSQALTLLK